MSLDLRAERLHLPFQFRQRTGIALFQFLYALGEFLGQPLHLTFNSNPDTRKPLVFDRQRLDLGFGKCAIAGQHLLIQAGVASLTTLAASASVSILEEALARINHEDAGPGVSVLLVDDQDTSRYAGAVKQIGWQADDTLDEATPNKILGDVDFLVATEQYSAGPENLQHSQPDTVRRFQFQGQARVYHGLNRPEKILLCHNRQADIALRFLLFIAQYVSEAIDNIRQ